MGKKITRSPYDAVGLTLFILMVVLSALGIKAGDWSDDLDLIAGAAFLGALAGIFLARSTFSARVAFLFGTAYGIFVAGWQIGGTLDSALIWRDRIFSLLGRLGAWLSMIAKGKPNEDSLMFVLMMVLLYWIMSCYGSWALIRKEGFWAAVLPPGMALLINEIVYAGSARLEGYLAVYILLVLILASRMMLWGKQQKWRRIQARVPESLGFHLSRAGIALAILIVIFAWGGPAFAGSEKAMQIWERASRPFDRILNRVGDAFHGLRTSGIATYDLFGNRLALEAGLEPNEVLVMIVDTERRPRGSGRFYWFSRVYNSYLDGNWYLDIGRKKEFYPEMGNLQSPDYEARDVIEVTIYPKLPAIYQLISPSNPLWVNRTAEAMVVQISDEQVDPLFVQSISALFGGEAYQSRGSIPIPIADDLREAGEAYPEWVTDYYLQVPEEITGRTRDLARALTEDLDNPYDKAVAITAWLRQNIEYSRVTEPPPADVEKLDWFLFDYKIGFCNWYASAEVILLRLLGIPARMAVGFAAGEYEPLMGTYQVRGLDAHAWPEVFFPGFGWVEFEPTVNQPALRRPERALDRGPMPPARDIPQLDDGMLSEMMEDRLSQDSLLAGEADSNQNYVLQWIILTLVTAIGATSLLLILRFHFDPIARGIAIGFAASTLERIGVRPPAKMVQSRLQDLTSIGKIYARLNLWLDRFGLSLAAADTPNERAIAFLSIHPQAGNLVWSIVDAYTAERFGRRLISLGGVRDSWRKLRTYLWVEWLKLLIEPLFRQRQPAGKKDESPGSLSPMLHNYN